MKIASDSEAQEYLDKIVREQLASQSAHLGAAHLLEIPFGDTLVKDKFGIGHHSGKERMVYAWAWTFEGLPEPAPGTKRWLIDTGEILEATQSEVVDKINRDNPNFDTTTAEDRKLINEFLHGPRENA